MKHALSEITLAHLQLDVADLARSELFYQEVLLLPVTGHGDSRSIRSAGFIIVLMAGSPQHVGSFHFGFRVADDAAVDEWFARFSALKVRIVESPVERGAVYVGRICDPDDYPIEIYAEHTA